ncbi:MAG: hypothetical protein II852_11135 [Bacteroidales bacterium]|nr:hypothetical protein [Bacteroidales bacterium]
MKKAIRKLIAFAALIAVMLAGVTACEEEVEQTTDDENEAVNTQETVADDEVLVVDGKRMEWTLPIRRNGLSKGVIADEKSLYSEIDELLGYDDDCRMLKTVTYRHKNKDNSITTYKIPVMRVDRRSEPGKFFYVMLENLNVKLDTACWAYGDNESYTNKYGRLYTWKAANALASKIKMSLPTYKASNPTETLISTPLPVSARLLSEKDVRDIIECDAVGTVEGEGYTIDNNYEAPGHGDFDIPLYYYDAFIGGLEGPHDENPDYERGEHSLGGYRNVIQQEKWLWGVWINGWYTRLDERGFFWLLDTSYPETTGHCPLRIIKNEKYNYSAYINVRHSDKFGYSVRYVFEPRYK